MKGMATITCLAIGVAFASSVSAQALNESTLLSRFKSLRASNTDPSKSDEWFQAVNHSEKCAVHLYGSMPSPPGGSYKWFGDCRNGKASGIGVAVIKTTQGDSISLDEYGLPGESSEVTYRQLSVGPKGKFIIKGHVTTTTHFANITAIGTTPKGNPAVSLVDEKCDEGECIRRYVDPMTGTTTYEVGGNSGYSVAWIDQRADNQPLFNRRAIGMDARVQVEKIVLDGVPYDFYHDLQSGRTVRVNFSDSVNATLAMPIEEFATFRDEIGAAAAEADSKFAKAYPRFCKAQKDKDVILLCDLSKLIPKDAELAAARAEINESGRTTYEQMHQGIAKANAQIAQLQTQQAQQAQLQAQQAWAEERKREEGREALLRGFEALNQVGQQAQRNAQQMMQSYSAPQVQPITPNRPDIIHCRTIGYTTMCN